MKAMGHGTYGRNPPAIRHIRPVPTRELGNEKLFLYLSYGVQCIYRQNSAFVKISTGYVPLRQFLLNLLDDRKRSRLPSWLNVFPWEKSFDEARS
jgi:hypothetical protein